MTESITPAAPAGWFPAGVEGQERYWDGTGWTDHVRPVNAASGGSDFVAPGSTAPEIGKKSRNILGIVALALAAVGFIFACIPGALIVGWILLPIAFILGIVALFQKDKPKWQGIAAIIVSVIGTIIGVVVFLVVAATAFGNAFDNTVTDKVGTSDIVEEEAPGTADKPALAAAQELVLGETAFGVDAESGMGWYAVQLTNPNEDYVFGNAAIKVEAYDANGVLLDTGTDYSTILSGSSWYVGRFLQVGSAQIDRIEVRGPTASAATNSPAAETGSFTVGEVTTGSEYDWMTVNGTLTSNFTEDQDMVRIDVIARNGDGKIVGVDTTYTDRVPAGGTAAWKVPLWQVPLDSKVEAFAHL